MNRIVSRIPPQRREPTSHNPYYRPTQKLRADAEAALRDVAYVLALTWRVKTSILEDTEDRKLASQTA
jgi:hypothetical protein